ncbi:MAG: hypothetical protein ACPGYT_11865 [Nitrospirales bacterium]
MTPEEFDDLHRFAAKKLGLGIRPTPTWPGTLWYGNSKYCGLFGEQFEPLTSFDLFGQGLAVARAEGWMTAIYANDLIISNCPRRHVLSEDFSHVNDIPKAFWRCWMNLEKSVEEQEA